MPPIRTAFPRLLPGAVVAVLVTLAIGGFVITSNSVEHEEERLLHERASEVAAILSSSTTMLVSRLELLGSTYSNSEINGSTFTASARSLITGGTTAVGVAQQMGDAVVVRAVEGTGLSDREVLTGEREELVRRALETQGPATMLIRGDESSLLVIAIAGKNGIVAFQESMFSNTPAASTPDSPFRELDAALYRTSTADSNNLIMTTTADLPLGEPLDSRLLDFGSEQWLLQTSAHGELAGSYSHAIPWIILAGGLAAALLTGGVVVILLRRRAYAMKLVDQRTADLTAAVTELENARIVADTANKSKSQFLSRMSHELRTPLNAVLGFAQLLELSELTPDDRDGVEHILKGGNHLLQLINEVIDISRIEAGEITLSSESVLASEVVAEALDLMRPLAAARSIHILADRQQSCRHYVFADRQRLKQIMLNLLSNAVKYNRIGGTLTVTCEEVSNVRLRLKVTDTGYGISSENTPLLFAPFERLGAEQSGIEGSGIGLALSKQLAEAMGGTLDLISAIGVGSTFWVELPLVEGAVERYERLVSSTPTATLTLDATRPRRILYIEDNLANVKLVQRILDGAGNIELVPAMQGRIGVDLAREHRPDLILMDLHLPDMRGDEVLQMLRDDPETSSIPVVVVSADATTNQVQRLQSAGASAYLTKPFNVRELMATISDLIGDPVPATPPPVHVAATAT